MFPDEPDPVLARIQPRWSAARTERNLNVAEGRLRARRRTRSGWRAAIVLGTLAVGGAALAARFDLLPRVDRERGRNEPGRPRTGVQRAPAPVASKPVAVEAVASAPPPAEAPPAAREPERAGSRPAPPSRAGQHVAQESAEDLMRAADEARRAGKAAASVPLLQRLLREHAADVRAPLAAFTLGRILLAQLHRPAEAADAFALSRRLAPQGALAGDALAREVEASARAGDGARAARLGAEYSRRYPGGRRLEAVRRWGGLD